MTRRLSSVIVVAAIVAGAAVAAFEPRPANAVISALEAPSGAAESGLDAIEETARSREAERPAASTGRLRLTEKTMTGNPLWAIPLKRLSATRERPVFSPSRRPPPAVAAPVAAPPKPVVVMHRPERPQLALVGTIIGTSSGMAIFIEAKTRKAILLKLGQNHNGWTLKSIAANAAKFEEAQQSVTITMDKHDGDGGLRTAPRPPTPRDMPGAAAVRRSAVSATTNGNASRLLDQSPAAASPLSERSNSFGSAPLFERRNR